MDDALREATALLQKAVHQERESMLGELKSSLAELRQTKADIESSKRELRQFYPIVHQALRMAVQNEESKARNDLVLEWVEGFHALSSQCLAGSSLLVRKDLAAVEHESRQLRILARLAQSEKSNRALSPEGGRQTGGVRPPSAPSRGGQGAAATSTGGGVGQGRPSSARRYYEKQILSSATTSPDGKTPSDGSPLTTAASTPLSTFSSPFSMFETTGTGIPLPTELALEGKRAVNISGQKGSVILRHPIKPSGVTSCWIRHLFPSAELPPLKRNLSLSQQHSVQLVLVGPSPSASSAVDDGDVVQLQAAVARVRLPHESGRFLIEVHFAEKALILKGEDGRVLQRDGVWSTEAANLTDPTRLRLSLSLVEKSSVVDVLGESPT